MVSDLVPQLGELADDMCFLHAMTSKTNTHGPGENFMSTGFTLDDVTKLLRPAPCGSVQHLIEDRLEEVGERMAELRHVQKVLRAALAECQGHSSTGRCKVVDDLSARAKRTR